MHLGLVRIFLILLAGLYSPAILAATNSDFPTEIIIEEAPYTDDVGTDGNVKNYLQPYKDRKQEYGGTVAVNVLFWTPSNFQPDFSIDNFEETYGQAEFPLVTLDFEFRWNTGIGGVGLQLGAGHYENENDDDVKLSVTPIFGAITLTLDTLLDEPYVAPYIKGGVAQILFEESVNEQKSGGSDTYFVYEGGLLLQLDWLDSSADFDSYLDSGVENTYLYVGIVGMTGTPVDDRDFTTPATVATGLRIQF